MIKHEGDGPMQQRGRETAPIFRSRLAHVFLHDRNPPADAEGEGGYFEAGGGLLSFVFVEVHFADHVVDHGLGKALGDQVATGEAFFHVAFEDRVEDVVGREAVLIHLARAEFGARGLFDGVERDNLATGSRCGGGIYPAGQGKDLGFKDVADHGEAAAHVAVERAVADGHFTFVTRREEERAELVRERHHQDTANAGLDILFGHVGGPAGEEGAKGGLGGNHGVGDGDRLETDAEVFREEASVVARVLRGDRGGQGDAEDVFGAEGVGGEHGDDGGVDAPESAMRARLNPLFCA